MVVLDEEKINEMGGRAGLRDFMREPDKKVVIVAPIFLKGLSYNKRWGHWPGGDQSYETDLYGRHGGDVSAGIREWIETQGRPVERSLRGPNPDISADEYLRDLARLQNYIAKYAPGRPIVIAGIGHQGDTDVAILDIIKGEITAEGFDEVFGGKLLNPNEGAWVKIDHGYVEVAFRGLVYHRQLNAEVQPTSAA